MEALDVIKEIRILMKTCLLNQTQKTSFSRQIDSIEKKCNDTNLYVGIIGEFYSRKTSLIDSLIGRKSFVLNSHVSTVLTSIRYGSTINLEFRYKDGKIEKYNKHGLSMIEKVLPKEYAKLSSADKAKIKTGDFFGIKGKDEFLLKIFDIATTSDSLTMTIEEIALYCPSKFLKNGIVLLDIPRTGHLNLRHGGISVNTSSYVYYIDFIIIPSGSPFCITISDHFSNNQFYCIEDRRFFNTKIEQFEKEKGKEKMKGVFAPNEQFNGLKHTSNKSLIDRYQNEYVDLFDLLSNNKKLLILSTIKGQLKDLLDKILISLKELSEHKQHLLDEKQVKRTPPLDIFIEKINRNRPSLVRDVILKRIHTEFSKARTQFECYVESIITEASTKKEMQHSIRSDQVIRKGEQSFQMCFDYVMNQANWLINSHLTFASNFEEEFKRVYCLSPFEFTPSMDIEKITIRKYKNAFSRFSISSFPLIRVFIDTETIRTEMLEAVTIYSETIFDKLFDYYSPKIIKLDDSIIKQLDKYLQKNLKTFSKPINSRIAQEMEMEKSIDAEINFTDKQIQTIKELEGLY